MDSSGITHTVALPDPSRAMSLEAVQSLDALSEVERAEVLDALEEWYWNVYVAGQREDIIASELGPEGEPLPDGYIVSEVSTGADDAALVESTDPAWRIDVLEAIQD